MPPVKKNSIKPITKNEPAAEALTIPFTVLAVAGCSVFDGSLKVRIPSKQFHLVLYHSRVTDRTPKFIWRHVRLKIDESVMGSANQLVPLE
jgi:hypothetical protein